MALDLVHMEIGEARGEFVLSLLKPSARPRSPLAAFRAAIPSPDFASRIIEPSSRRKTSSTFKESSEHMARYNGKIGILAANGRGYNAGNAAKNIAQALYALDFDVSQYGCIVALLEENLMCADNKPVPYDPDRAKELGIEIVYDLNGVFGQGAIDKSSGTLSVQQKHICFDGSRIDRSDRLDMMIRQETLKTMVSIARKYHVIKQTYYWHDDETEKSLGVKDMQNLSRLLSFGLWNLEELVPEDPSYDGYDCSIPLESHGFGLVEGLVRDDVVKKMDELCQIWKAVLLDFGLDFDVARIALSGNMKELGQNLGIDNGVKAYIKGVPIEDLLA